MEPGGKIDVAVVLGTYQRLALLQKAIASIRRAAGKLRCQVIVVDGGSTDGTREWLAEQPDVTAVLQELPLTGAVAAFNLGFAAAVDCGAPWVGILNDDDELVGLDGVCELEAAVAAMRADPGVGAVAFETNLRGAWSCEIWHGKPYCNKGVVRRDAGMAAARAAGDPTGKAWWCREHRTYASDTELGCWIWRLGWSVAFGKGLRVHDNARDTSDTMRTANVEDYKRSGTVERFRKRWLDPKRLEYSFEDASRFGGRVKRSIRLHLGCGSKLLPGWVNCDGADPHADRRLRLPDGLADLPAACCEWLYSSHTIEHVEFDSLPQMFAHLHRVMVPGGKVTLATIDINGIYHNRYKAGIRDASWNAALYGETWGMDRPFISHLCCFDWALLSRILTDAGFTDVRQWEVAQYPEIAALHDCASTDRDVSLLVEATA